MDFYEHTSILALVLPTTLEDASLYPRAKSEKKNNSEKCYEAIKENSGFWGLAPKRKALATDSPGGSLVPIET